jgi:hypothetical protein
MFQSESLSSIAPDLVKAQAGINGVAKDGNNPIFRSKYITLDSILLAVRPVLSGCNIFLSQSVDQHSENDGVINGVTVRSTLIHSSGEWIANEVTVPVNPIVGRDGKVQPVDAHRVGSAITYGRRYSLSALLAIGEASDTDDDGNTASGYQNQSQAPQQHLRQPQAPQQQAPKTPAPPKVVEPTPLERFNGQIDRLYGKDTSKDDRKGIHNAIAGSGKEVKVTSDSLTHVADCLSECKDQAEADEFITGCMKAAE